MHITRWGEYGIICCLYLARSYEQAAVGAAEIAKTQAIPEQYTRQILQRLRKGGVITSVRGASGGYRLCRAPQKISLREVVAAAEGTTFEIICESDPPYKVSCHRSEVCGLQEIWHGLKQCVDTYLERISLADLQQRQAELAQKPKLVKIANNSEAKSPVALGRLPNAKRNPLS
jgi:Rrf2 family cysteine metabolism transcriptional repressor